MATFDRQAAKKAGYTDAEINSFLGQPSQKTSMGSVSSVKAPEQNLVSKILGILSPGIVNIGRDISESFRVGSKVLPQAQSQEQNLQQAGLLAKQAAQETDPNRRAALLDQSRKFSSGYAPIETGFSQDIERGYLDRGLQAGVEGGLLATPFLGKLGGAGKAVQSLASKSPVLQNILNTGLKSGAVGGALLGATQEGDIGQRLTKSVTGGLTGGIIGGALDKASDVYSGIKNILNKSVSSKASQAFTKATPSAFNKIVVQHGKDINNLAQKYVPSGAGYDDMLGAISQRGKGGIIGNNLSSAEQIIKETADTAGKNFRIKPEDLLKNLEKQRKIISTEIGGAPRLKALDLAIEQVKEKYKSGATLKQSLDTLRYANKKFGESVIKTKASDAIAGAVQKAEANALGSTIKKIFPDIADALDTQSELLTLRPILDRARSTASTQGSKIRVGRSPLDIIDFPFQKPEIASRLMQQGATSQPKDMSSASLLSALGIGPFLKGEKPGEIAQPSQTETTTPSPTQGMVITPQQMQQVEISPNLSSKTKESLRKVYDIQQKQNKPLSSVAAEKVAKGNRGLRALASLEKQWSPEKTILSKIPGAPGAQIYRSDAGNIIDVIGYISTGAAIDKNQRKDYEYLLPTPLDDKEIVKQKIDTIRQMFTDYVEGQRATSGSFDLEQIMK